MKNKILIASHGDFSKGIIDSLKMITGIKDVDYISAYKDPNIDYGELMESYLSKHDYTKENLVVITDLLGGSVNNEFILLKKKFPFLLVTGLNLSLLLEIITTTDVLDEEKLKKIVESNRKMIVVCDEDIYQATISDNEDF